MRVCLACLYLQSYASCLPARNEALDYEFKILSKQASIFSSLLACLLAILSRSHRHIKIIACFTRGGVAYLDEAIRDCRVCGGGDTKINLQCMQFRREELQHTYLR